MTTTGLILAAAACLVGASLQRSTGMGFAVVTAPFLMLLLGPVDGIVVTNVGSVATSLLSSYQLRADFDVPRARWLIPCGILGCLPGAAVVRLLPPAWVGVAVGLLVLVALVVTMTAPGGRVADSPPVRAVAGLVSGFMNTAAGVGGPALAVYMRSTGWARAPFAATATTIFAVQGVVSLLAKQRWLPLPWWAWVGMGVALGTGIVLGGRLHGRLDDRLAMRAVMALATLGTLLALGRSVAALAAS